MPDEDQIHVLVKRPQPAVQEKYGSAEVQLANSLSTLEWKEPNRLCASAGRDWPY